jgi:hypothetical protein
MPSRLYGRARLGCTLAREAREHLACAAGQVLQIRAPCPQKPSFFKKPGFSQRLLRRDARASPGSLFWRALR